MLCGEEIISPFTVEMRKDAALVVIAEEAVTNTEGCMVSTVSDAERPKICLQNWRLVETSYDQASDIWDQRDEDRCCMIRAIVRAVRVNTARAWEVKVVGWSSRGSIRWCRRLKWIVRILEG